MKIIGYILNISSTHLQSLNQLLSLILLQLSWSGDGKKLLSASADKTAKIWDITAEKASTLDLTLLHSFLLSIEQQCCLSLLFVTCHNTVEVCKLLQIEKNHSRQPSIPHIMWKKRIGEVLSISNCGMPIATSDVFQSVQGVLFNVRHKLNRFIYEKKLQTNLSAS